MKYHKIVLCLALLLTACSKNFEDINTSPDLVEKPTLDYLLPNIQLTLLDNAYYTSVTLVAQVMYQISNNGTNFASLAIGTNKDYHFEYQYATAIKNLVDFVDRTKDDPELINYNCMGRIMKAYAFHSLTDAYGDIPYFQAGKGYIDRTFQPEYDEQQKIYADLFNELNDAAQKLDASKKLPVKTDIVYKGDVTKWKKFAYSLMLRLALRISKADPANSAKWISTAVKAGMFESNADNFTVLYKPNTYYATISNGQPTPFIYYTSWKLSAPFVDYLRDNRDPRIYIYSALPNGDTTMSKQIGLPPFLPANQLPKPLTEYSVSPPATFGKYDAPFIHMSYSEVQLMLSEIAMRELVPEVSKANAATYYNNGVRAAMAQLSIYGGNYTIPAPAIDEYVAAHPLNTNDLAAALERINTEYWIETHYNFYETFSNWRRSGYPKFDGLDFDTPRRIPYPGSEGNINGENMQKAIERQGPDLVTTHVWWDE